jgi:hypothetical protein
MSDQATKGSRGCTAYRRRIVFENGAGHDAISDDVESPSRPVSIIAVVCPNPLLLRV